MLPRLPTDEVLTTRPQARSRMPGSAACAQRKVPFRLTSSTASHCSSVIFAAIASRLIPALLMRMSRRPKASTACSTMRSHSLFRVTSPATTSALAPALRISPATVSRPAAFASLIATSAPSRAKRRAVAAPIPPAAPVTRATFPDSLMRSPSLKGGGAIPVEVAANHDPQDLRRAAAGEQEARVAEVPLHRVLHGEAVGGEDARRVVGHLHRRLGGEQLRHGRLAPDGVAAVHARRGLVRHERGGTDRRQHVGE